MNRELPALLASATIRPTSLSTAMTVHSKHTIPGDPVLGRLVLAAAQTSESKIIIHDAYGYEKTYLHLLGDILQMRSLLQARLAGLCIDKRGMLENEGRYVGVLSRSG